MNRDNIFIKMFKENIKSWCFISKFKVEELLRMKQFIIVLMTNLNIQAIRRHTFRDLTLDAKVILTLDTVQLDKPVTSHSRPFCVSYRLYLWFSYSAWKVIQLKSILRFEMSTYGNILLFFMSKTVVWVVSYSASKEYSKQYFAFAIQRLAAKIANYWYSVSRLSYILVCQRIQDKNKVALCQ